MGLCDLMLARPVLARSSLGAEALPPVTAGSVARASNLRSAEDSSLFQGGRHHLLLFERRLPARENMVRATNGRSRKFMPLAAAPLLPLLLLQLCLFCHTSRVASGDPSSGSAAINGRAQLVSVSAPWPTSCLSPLAEASEFVAEGSGGAGRFWEYVEAVGDAPHWVFSCDSSELGAVAVAAATTAAANGREGGADAAGPHNGSLLGKEEGGAASVAAVKAAGRGFGGETGGGTREAGLGLDEFSLRLMEVALSARYCCINNVILALVREERLTVGVFVTS